MMKKSLNFAASYFFYYFPGYYYTRTVFATKKQPSPNSESNI